MLDLARLRAAYEKARDELLAERTPDGHWVGELSSSALSTATAVSALSMVKQRVGWDKAALAADGPPPGDRHVGRRSPSELVPPYDDVIRRGVAWLIRQQNEDGGFGDTDLSHSNIATTMLVVAALKLAGVAEEHFELIERANRYIDAKGRLQGLRERYGIDKTFVVPIMMNLALAGIVDWRDVDPLPFELACVPQAWYRFVGMPVVSYAIPALVAIGQARYFHAPPRNPFMRLLRWLSIERSLRVLRRMQPDSGGYLEATPLTSFVVMSLASVPKPRPLVAVYEEAEAEQTATTGRGFADQVIREGVKFLVNFVRPDGSWPIDTNLATWNTTLAINALAGAGEDVAALLGPKCLDWLLSCQHLKRHPFTGADPGGFGWSDLSGAVPDADDTPGALLALCAFCESPFFSNVDLKRMETARYEAVGWLFKLHNRDGGWPTFCRGWGKLPFDRSGVDLTAHVLRALVAKWPIEGTADAFLDENERSECGPVGQVDGYFKFRQHADGSWSPLWFGNQDHPNEENPVYGTAKVLMAYRDLDLMDSPEAQRGIAWLLANQNEDGGWGSGVWGKVRSAECGMRSEGPTKRTTQRGVELLGEPELSAQYSVLSTTPSSHDETSSPKSKIQNLKSSVEETALAVEALLAAVPPSPEPRTLNPASAAVTRGLAWLIDRVETGQHRQPAPIGFYFAKLWYYEKLYPLIFTVAALGRACRQFAHTEPSPHLPAEPASSDA